MKWYSVNKYQPVLSCSLTLVRVKTSPKNYYFELAEYDGEEWVDWIHKEPIAMDGHKVTHFCIPEPIEIDE